MEVVKMISVVVDEKSKASVGDNKLFDGIAPDTGVVDAEFEAEKPAPKPKTAKKSTPKRKSSVKTALKQLEGVGVSVKADEVKAVTEAADKLVKETPANASSKETIDLAVKFAKDNKLSPDASKAVMLHYFTALFELNII